MPGGSLGMIASVALSSVCSPPITPCLWGSHSQGPLCCSSSGLHDHNNPSKFLSLATPRPSKWLHTIPPDETPNDRLSSGESFRKDWWQGGSNCRTCCGCGLATASRTETTTVSGASSSRSSHASTSVVPPLYEEWICVSLKFKRIPRKKWDQKLRYAAPSHISPRMMGGLVDWLTIDQVLKRTGNLNSRQKFLSVSKSLKAQYCDNLESKPVLRKLPEDLGLSYWKRSQAAIAAAAVASLLSVSLSSSAIATPDNQVFERQESSLQDLEMHLEGRVRLELETEIQLQRKVWGIIESSVSSPPSQQLDSQSSQTISPHQEQKDATTPEAGPKLAVNVSEDSLKAWQKLEVQIELEGERLAVPITRPVEKPKPQKVAEKTAVAASVAVAALGSVAGAASAASRVAASTGATAASVSLAPTLHAVGNIPGANFLIRAAQHFGGGGVAGAVGATVVYPLDTIKTRMQAQSSLEGEEPQYKDEIDCLKQLVVKEGPASLYSGLVPQLLGIAPEKAMKLTVNEMLLGVLETMMPGARIWLLEFIAGGGGGFSQVVFTNPMEIVKVRLQTQAKDGVPKTMFDVVRELGVLGLYRGAGITMARDVPSSAIFFACYTLLQQLYPDQNFMAGCLAAIPATVLVTPMDIIKTRLQKEPTPGEEPYRDWLQCLQLLIEREGPQALFKGSLVRVIRTSPQFGITLTLYSLFFNGS